MKSRNADNRPAFDFSARRNRLRRETGHGWLLLYKGGEYFNDNLYYLTGIDSFHTLALISLEDETEIVLTNRFEFPVIQQNADIADIRECPSTELINQLLDLFASHKISLLHCDYTIESRIPLPAAIIDQLRDANPNLQVKDIPQELLRMRMVKEPKERALIRRGVAVVAQLFDDLPDYIAPGVTEAEISALIHKELISKGFNRFFDIFVASGTNSTIPIYQMKTGVLPPDHVVLIDICAAIQNYVVDITRTFPTSGEFTPEAQRLYDIVKQVQRQILDSLNTGVTLRELSEQAKELFGEKGLERFYLNKIGHFVGLMPDDPGEQDMPLQKGMVITIEPGLYIPEKSIGLRVENTVLVE